jgi:hypothetical protein
MERVGQVFASPRRDCVVTGLKMVIARGHFAAPVHLPVLEMQMMISICHIRRV